MASEDTERYKNEMQTYNGRQEAKMRSEALKPPVTYPSNAGGPGRGGEYPGGAPGADGRGPGGYPEQMANMSAFANPGAAGMELVVTIHTVEWGWELTALRWEWEPTVVMIPEVAATELRWEWGPTEVTKELVQDTVQLWE